MAEHDAGDNKPLPLSVPDTDSVKSTPTVFLQENALHLQVSTKADADVSFTLSYDNNNNTHFGSSSNNNSNNNNNHPQLRFPTCAFIPACASPVVCATPAVPARSTLPTRTRPPRPSPHRCAIALTMRIPVGHWASVSPGLRRRHSRNAKRQRQRSHRRRQGVRSMPRLAPRASPLLHMGQLGIMAAGMMLTAGGALR